MKPPDAPLPRRACLLAHTMSDSAFRIQLWQPGWTPRPCIRCNGQHGCQICGLAHVTQETLGLLSTYTTTFASAEHREKCRQPRSKPCASACDWLSDLLWVASGPTTEPSGHSCVLYAKQIRTESGFSDEEIRRCSTHAAYSPCIKPQSDRALVTCSIGN